MTWYLVVGTLGGRILGVYGSALKAEAEAQAAKSPTHTCLKMVDRKKRPAVGDRI